MLISALTVLFATVIAFILPFSQYQLLVSGILMAGSLALCLSQHQFNRQNLYHLFLVYSAFAILLTANQTRIQSWIDSRVSSSDAGQTASLLIKLNSFPILHSYYQSVTAEVLDAEVTRNLTRLKLYWPLEKDLEPGQVWQVDCRLKPPLSVRSPGAYNPRYMDFLTHIDGSCQVVTSQLIKTQPSLIHSMQHSIQHWLEQQSLPRETKGWVLALALGDKRWLSSEQIELLNTSQTRHLFVVSGLHLTIVFAWVALVAGWSIRPLALFYHGKPLLWIPLISGFAATVLYAALCGFTVPTTRALVMLSVVVATLLRPTWQWVNGFCMAVILVALLDPASVLLPGTWMSFSAVLILLITFHGRKTLTTGHRHSRYQQWCKPQLRIAGGLIPLQLLLGFGINPAAILVNLVAIPVIALVILPGLMVMLLTTQFGTGNFLLSGIDHVRNGLEYLMRLAEVIANKPVIPIAGLLVLFGLVVIWLLPKALPGRNGLLLLMFVFLPVSLLEDPEPIEGIQVVQFDVGQGQSLLVRHRDTNILIDTGPGMEEGRGAFSRVVLPYLQRLGIDHLDMVIISHSDQDHASDLMVLNNKIKIDQWLAGEDLKVAANRCQTGQRWQFQSLMVETLFSGHELGLEGNNASCVIRASDPKHGSMLVPGDITKSIEYRLLDQFPTERLQVELLFAAHHGSRSSSSWQWLKDTFPKRVSISAGPFNRFKHPHPDVVAKLDRLQIPWSDTAHTGTVRFDIVNQQVFDQILKPDRWYWLFD